MTGYERIKTTLEANQVDYPASIFIATSVACRLAGVKQSEWSTQPKVSADTLIDFTEKCGCDGIQYGDSSASMLSPALFEQFALPYQLTSIDQLQQETCDFWLHICGQTDHLLPLLRALHIQVFEVDTMVLLAKAGQALTSCVIKGNLDTMTLQDSSAEEIYRATQTMITESGLQGRLIVSAGCGVPQMTPLENLQAMTRACREIDA